MEGKESSDAGKDSFITTIKIDKETKERLERMKEHNRETYDEVIKKILYILNHIRKDPISANRILGKIDANIKRKGIYSKKKASGKAKEEEREEENEE